jgi:secondary thiamine-phosphate synthase enzyme
MTQLDVKTHARDELIDITSSVNNIVINSQVKNGVCLIYVPHTTAGVTINENADPSVRSDILMALRNLVPDSLPYSHMEGNSPGHVKSSLVGCSASILINNGSLFLGTWQGIFFCEFDGPRNRKVLVKIIPSSELP